MLRAADLDHCFDGVGDAWERLRGSRLFLTGGTGILGKWMLEALLEADRRLDLGVRIVALSRNPAAFAVGVPHLARSARLQLVEGDVRDFGAPDGAFDTVIHAATDVIAPLGPLHTFDTCVTGTRRVLEFASAAGVKDLLLLSSGAVYGPQPANVANMPESYLGGPDPLSPSSAYGEGKRVSEWLGAVYGHEGALQVKVARIYANVGPYLPLDKHFAIGNFIQDAMAGRAVVVRGDGTNVRSYLYLADVAVWLWTILLRGRSGAAYNVGSEEGIALGDLARRVSRLLGSDAPVEIHGVPAPGAAPEIYVPYTALARDELGLTARIGLDDAVFRTADWFRSCRSQ